MKTIVRLTALTVAMGIVCNAHWPWAELSGNEARVSFGLFPDAKLKGRVLARLTGGKYWALDAKGRASELAVKAGEDFVSASASGAAAVVGIIDYGVFSGEGEPSRLVFTMKGVRDWKKSPQSSAKLPVELVSKGAALQVLQDGKPAPGAEITIYEAAQGVAHRAEKKKGEIPNEAILTKSGKDGVFAVPTLTPGEYVAIANITDNTPGTHEGTAYKKRVHMTTLQFSIKN